MALLFSIYRTKKHFGSRISLLFATDSAKAPSNVVVALQCPIPLIRYVDVVFLRAQQGSFNSKREQSGNAWISTGQIKPFCSRRR